jgi:hypothetical protein
MATFSGELFSGFPSRWSRLSISFVPHISHIVSENILCARFLPRASSLFVVATGFGFHGVGIYDFFFFRSSHPAAMVKPSGSPISRSVSTGLSRLTDDEGAVIEGGVDALSISSGESACDLKACSRCGGRSLPLRAALRRMPALARCESEYLCGTLGCKMSVRVVILHSHSEDEHPSPPLRDSAVSRVQSPPRNAVPEVNKRGEERRHVSTGMGTE